MTTRRGLGELTNQTITKEETNLAIEAIAPLANHAFKVVLIDYASMVGEGRDETVAGRMSQCAAMLTP